jgi:hypothetical protein
MPCNVLRHHGAKGYALLAWFVAGKCKKTGRGKRREEPYQTYKPEKKVRKRRGDTEEVETRECKEERNKKRGQIREEKEETTVA